MAQPTARIEAPLPTEPRAFLDVRPLARTIYRRQGWFIAFLLLNAVILYGIFGTRPVVTIQRDTVPLNIVTVQQVYINHELVGAWNAIIPGIAVTMQITVFSFLLALFVGVVVAFGRISKNALVYNTSTFYVELFRGLPLLVIILIFSFVITPALIGVVTGPAEAPRDNCQQAQPLQPAIPFLDDTLQRLASIPEEQIPCTFVRTRDIEQTTRIVFAFAVTYGAFMSEVFRSGIESIGRGQMEAARSLGMTYAQAMRLVILPQAVRNTLPSLGNNFILLLKDTSLASTVAVPEISRLTTQYFSNNFRYPEALLVLSFLYANLTIILAMLVYGLESYLASDRRER